MNSGIAVLAGYGSMWKERQIIAKTYINASHSELSTFPGEKGSDVSNWSPSGWFGLLEGMYPVRSPLQAGQTYFPGSSLGEAPTLGGQVNYISLIMATSCVSPLQSSRVTKTSDWLTSTG